MEPALHDGQLAWTRPLRNTDRILRGDLVIVDSIELGRRIIKRVIGLPTEQIEIRDGAVTVDGTDLDEPYAAASVFHGSFAVPDGHYLLLGDNRDASNDSRSWQQPYISKEQIKGRIRRTLNHSPAGGSFGHHARN